MYECEVVRERREAYHNECMGCEGEGKLCIQCIRVVKTERKAVYNE